MKTLLTTFLLASLTLAGAQSFTSYFTGNAEDAVVAPLGGVCLMGGARESDEAMRWFLQRANGGDVLVLRASGSDGYNDYLYSELGVPVNSVETIVFHDSAAAYDAYVLERIARAEAVWLAGGNQWNYVRFWRNTPVDSLINAAIREKQLPIGGTSAGMAVLGQFYFSARHGTVTSAAALADPYDQSVTVDSTAFFEAPLLNAIITDTHFSNRERQGRLAVFLARIFADYGIKGRAIACDERTAVCIDTEGWATVYGTDPGFENHAYFIQTDCVLDDPAPENCRPGQPLSWKNGKPALRAYKVRGTTEGSGNFNLRNWQRGNGGQWENWEITEGELKRTPARPQHCDGFPPEKK